MIQSLFYFLAIVSIVSAILVIVARNPVYSVLWLVVTFFSIAAQYILLNAQFLAVVNVIVYAGAIMVLFLFVIMLMNLHAAIERNKSRIMQFGAVIAAGLLMLTLVSALRGSADIATQLPATNTTGLVKVLGQSLYTQYLLPFEVSSVLFLVAIVGALALGKKEITN